MCSYVFSSVVMPLHPLSQAISGMSSPNAASPAVSVDPVGSVFTNHSSKCSETEASSYTEVRAALLFPGAS